MTTPLFEAGELYITPGAIAAFRSIASGPLSYVARHLCGDWGDLSPSDKTANRMALKHGTRILSAYVLGTGTRIWIITEGTGDDGRRHSTTVLLPEEY